MRALTEALASRMLSITFSGNWLPDNSHTVSGAGDSPRARCMALVGSAPVRWPTEKSQLVMARTFSGLAGTGARAGMPS